MEEKESERKRVNLVVSKQKKEKWEEFTTDSDEYSSLSDLIRASVAHEMAGRNQTDSGPIDSDIAISIGEMLDKLDDLGNRFNSVENRLSTLEREVGRDPEIEELSTEVYQIIPDKKPGTKSWEDRRDELNHQLQAAKSGIESDENVVAWEGTIKQLADVLGEPEYRIHDAVEMLLRNTQTVRKIEAHGEMRYYRSE